MPDKEVFQKKGYSRSCLRSNLSWQSLARQLEKLPSVRDSEVITDIEVKSSGISFGIGREEDRNES